MAIADPALEELRGVLRGVYGERIERIVLYGSRARGDARSDSDYDVAVFLKDLTDRWAEMDKLAAIGVDVLNKTGSLIHVMPYKAGSYAERTPLMHELRQEGVDL